MARLEEISVERFRCFEKLTVKGFGRVNVIVGANNTGKSALLEAIELLVTKGRPGTLRELLRARGQVFVGASGEEFCEVPELVFGRPNLRQAKPDTLLFRVSAGGSSVPLLSNGAEISMEAAELWKAPVQAAGRGIASQTLALADEAFATARPPVTHLRSALSDTSLLQRQWAPLAGNPGEATVINALRCIDKTIEKVVFAPTGSESRGWDGWYIRREGSQVREALSGQGEGLKRALALSIALANAEHGTLLIDEIENGLHYSVIPELWHFLIHAARNLDVQVFITSHSRDLIDGFGKAQATSGAPFDDVAFFRLERGRTEAVRVSHRVAASLHETELEFR